MNVNGGATMSNLDKAKAIVAKREQKALKKEQNTKAELDFRIKAMASAKKKITEELKSYNGVDTTVGKLKWHPKLLELRANGKSFISITVGWNPHVCVWEDDDSKVYSSCPNLRARYWKEYNSCHTKEYNNEDSFLRSIAIYMADVL